MRAPPQGYCRPVFPHSEVDCFEMPDFFLRPVHVLNFQFYVTLYFVQMAWLARFDLHVYDYGGRYLLLLGLSSFETSAVLGGRSFFPFLLGIRTHSHPILFLYIFPGSSWTD